MTSRIKILIRRNLKLSRGKMAAQAVHAAIAAMPHRMLTLEELLMSVVVLEVSDAKFEAAKAAHAAGGYTLVRDAGYTEVEPMTETAMAFMEPDPRAEQPDAYCVTEADGNCVSTDPRCMHHQGLHPAHRTPKGD